MTSWLIDAINILTGNWTGPGGVMFTGGGIPTPILFNECLSGGVPPLGRWRSRVRNLPETVGMLPTAALADEILTPGEGQVRALITQAGNLALSNPNGPGWLRLSTAWTSCCHSMSTSTRRRVTRTSSSRACPTRSMPILPP